MLAQSEAPARETARWLALLKLRQRRLVTLKREDLRLVEDEVHPVSIAGCPPLFCLREDARTLLESDSGNSRSEEAARQDSAKPTSLVTSAATQSSIRLLAPLDPIIYDRRLTRALWNFDYTWEAYTPPLRRMRGYYALPVLAGTEIVGHVDPKADRAQRRLGETGGDRRGVRPRHPRHDFRRRECRARR